MLQPPLTDVESVYEAGMGGGQVNIDKDNEEELTYNEWTQKILAEEGKGKQEGNIILDLNLE